MYKCQYSPNHQPLEAKRRDPSDAQAGLGRTGPRSGLRKREARGKRAGARARQSSRVPLRRSLPPPSSPVPTLTDGPG